MFSYEFSHETENLPLQNRCFMGGFCQFSSHLTKCDACHRICTLSPLHAALTMWSAKNTQCDTSEVLRLPCKMTMEVSKVQRLARKPQFIVRKMLECQKVQHLPRETKLRDIWSAELTISTATRLSRERLWTVADGCGRLRAVAQRLANTAATPKLQNETGTLVTHSGKIGQHFWLFFCGIHRFGSRFQWKYVVFVEVALFWSSSGNRIGSIVLLNMHFVSACNVCKLGFVSRVVAMPRKMSGVMTVYMFHFVEFMSSASLTICNIRMPSELKTATQHFALVFLVVSTSNQFHEIRCHFSKCWQSYRARCQQFRFGSVQANSGLFQFDNQQFDQLHLLPNFGE